MRIVDADALTEMLNHHKKDCNPDHFDGHETFIDKIDAHDGYGEWQFANGFNFGIVASIVETKHAPTVDTVKHGHWEGKPIAGYSTVRCSECGDAFVENSGKWNYCPNCGADMRGEQDEAY